MAQHSISACLVVRHEEAMIGRCLASLQTAVDEIIVVHDGRCEDRTLDIALSYGARVYERPFKGHGEAHRPFAYEQARSDWLLRIDADEFLSEELAKQLPALARREDVDGYEFRWPVWRGDHYVDSVGPWRLALLRRARTSMVGLIQEVEQVRGPVERTSLRLEHQPAYDNYSLRTMATKWRRWARIHARELTGPFDALPKFNYLGPDSWSTRRRILNWFGPLLLVPYAFAYFASAIWRNRDSGSDLRQNIRFAFALTVYMTMVQVYVAACQIRKLRRLLRR